MRWRKSSFSQGNSDCVELAEADQLVYLRNSRHPGRATLALPAAVVADFVSACDGGEWDELAN